MSSIEETSLSPHSQHTDHEVNSEQPMLLLTRGVPTLSRSHGIPTMSRSSYSTVSMFSVLHTTNKSKLKTRAFILNIHLAERSCPS